MNFQESIEKEFSFGDSAKISRINSAGLVNSALHNLWLDFFRHFREGKYLSANNDLDCLWTILGGEKGIENSDIENSYNKTEKRLFDSGNLQDNIQVKGFDKIDDKQVNKFIKHKIILKDKALFLRRLQNSQGKGTAYHDEDEGDFD